MSFFGVHLFVLFVGCVVANQPDRPRPKNRRAVPGTYIDAPETDPAATTPPQGTVANTHYPELSAALIHSLHTRTMDGGRDDFFSHVRQTGAPVPYSPAYSRFQQQPGHKRKNSSCPCANILACTSRRRNLHRSTCCPTDVPPWLLKPLKPGIRPCPG